MPHIPGHEEEFGLFGKDFIGEAAAGVRDIPRQVGRGLRGAAQVVGRGIDIGGRVADIPSQVAGQVISGAVSGLRGEERPVTTPVTQPATQTGLDASVSSPGTRPQDFGLERKDTTGVLDRAGQPPKRQVDPSRGLTPDEIADAPINPADFGSIGGMFRILFQISAKVGRAKQQSAAKGFAQREKEIANIETGNLIKLRNTLINQQATGIGGELGTDEKALLETIDRSLSSRVSKTSRTSGLGGNVASNAGEFQAATNRFRR